MLKPSISASFPASAPGGFNWFHRLWLLVWPLFQPLFQFLITAVSSSLSSSPCFNLNYNLLSSHCSNYSIPPPVSTLLLDCLFSCLCFGLNWSSGRAAIEPYDGERTIWCRQRLCRQGSDWTVSFPKGAMIRPIKTFNTITMEPWGVFFLAMLSLLWILNYNLVLLWFVINLLYFYYSKKVKKKRDMAIFLGSCTVIGLCLPPLTVVFTV